MIRPLVNSAVTTLSPFIYITSFIRIIQSRQVFITGYETSHQRVYVPRYLNSQSVSDTPNSSGSQDCLYSSVFIKMPFLEQSLFVNYLLLYNNIRLEADHCGEQTVLSGPSSSSIPLFQKELKPKVVL